MIKRLIEVAMRNYQGADMVIRMKAGFFILACLSVLFILPLVIAYSMYVQTTNPFLGFSLSYYILIPEFSAFAILLLVIFLFVRGRFSLAAHMLLIFSFFATWAVMFLDRSSTLSKMDSVVFILAVMTITPLAVARRKIVILSYGLVNLLVLIVFTFISSSQGYVPDHSFVDYLADNTVAILFITLISYYVFVINNRALKQMESDLLVRKRAENELLDSRRRLADIINFLPDPTFAVDLEQRVIIWNSGMEAMTGIPSRDIIGQTGYAIPFFGHERPILVDYILDRSEKTKRLYPDIIEAGDMVTSEVYVPEIGTGGAYLWSAAKPLYDAAGKIAGAIETVRDITERRRQDNERARLEEQLLHAQKMESVGRLAGGIAHDFNNLLTTIIGNTGLLQMDANEGAPEQSRLNDIMKAAESAAALTKQLLAFSRKQMIEPKLIDLNALIEETWKLIARLIGEDITPIMILSPSIGMIMADPGQIEQIIINLVVNSRDAMPGGGKLIIETRRARIETPPPVAVPAMIPGDYVAFTITDTGTGISDEAMRHLFDPFFTTKPVGKGTGLGLASVYGAVTQNGGSIEVKTSPGKGTAMTVYLPAAGQGITPEDTAQRKDILPGGAESVLLVEDDESVREFIHETLAVLGYRVTPAGSALDAIGIAERAEAPFDLLLADVVLPDMAAPRMAERIMVGAPETSVLYISGHSESEVVSRGIISNGLNFLAKPFTAQSLAIKVRETLDRTPKQKSPK